MSFSRGWDRISVTPGQPVLAGEPLGMMGDGDGLAKPRVRSSMSSFARTAGPSIPPRGGPAARLGNSREGQGMVRKTSLLLVGALLGATP
jgi:septal ring factor EnvC (AmiA/AmiB activator)